MASTSFLSSSADNLREQVENESHPHHTDAVFGSDKRNLGAPSLELRDVGVRFGSVSALESVTLEIYGGTSVALMGSNGSGKTTLLRAIAGLGLPTSGALTTKGHRGGALSIAYVGQHQHQHGWIPLTVSEVLTMGRYRSRRLLGRITSGDRELIRQAAERLDVVDLLSTPFGDLSGGQRQRALVAGALANDADCLLLDEPITGLDPGSQRAILEVVDQERDRGRIVVLSTHHLSEARRCDRVVLLAGNVIADGSPDEVLTEPNLAAAFGLRLLGGGTESDGSVIVIDEHGHGHGDGHGHEPLRPGIRQP